jgi:hypothetical protein
MPKIYFGLNVRLGPIQHHPKLTVQLGILVELQVGFLDTAQVNGCFRRAMCSKTEMK